MPVDVDIKPVLARAYAINLRRAHIASLCRVNATALSLAASGQQDLSYPDFRAVEILVSDLEELARRAGAPLDWRDTANIKRLLGNLDAERKSPPPAIDRNDWELLTAVCTGRSPLEIAKDLGTSIRELSERLDSANKRFGAVSSFISRSTRELQTLTDCSVTEREARKNQ